ncbi:hypothetical protein C8035_v005494 [Colletotrichum spinosum]|uniref:Nephrocystin 3-like N-terminal domain-containing protein n=1 Tax=Colletotrichum spinosum TaxID=1347390 RepID=A0A4R8QTC5_9PEZI|nr:hypothetical protein C8035_v005494 [Colletotrichum spinosum]
MRSDSFEAWRLGEDEKDEEDEEDTIEYGIDDLLHWIPSRMNRTGFRKWGRYLTELKRNCQDYLFKHQYTTLEDSFDLTVMDNHYVFDGASTHDIRQHFMEWVEMIIDYNCFTRNREGWKVPHGVLRRKIPFFEYCLFVDKECLDAFEAFECSPLMHESQRPPMIFGAIDRLWTPDRDYGSTGMNNRGFPPIEDCDRRFVDWVYHDARNIVSLYNKLQVLYLDDLTAYRRPPAIEFQHWLSKSDSKLWLKGIPGAGKTVLAASIIEAALERSTESTPTAFFFCDYKDTRTQVVENILGALAYQLAIQKEDAFKMLERYYEELNPGNGLPKQSSRKGLEKLLGKMLKIYDHAYLIVDVLMKDSDNVSIALLSRDEYEIRELLQSDFTPIEIAAHKSDITEYVTAEIEERIRTRRLCIYGSDLKGEIIEGLIHGAKGM